MTFSNPKQVLPALLLSLLIHALVFYAWPNMQAVSFRPILVQGELVAPKVEEPAPLPEPPYQQPSKIEPESTPILHKAPEPRPQQKAPEPRQQKALTPAPKKEAKKAHDDGVALPLLTEKADATSVGANDYAVPDVPPLTHEDKLPMASRPGETPLEQYSPTSEPSSTASESDKTAPASADGDDQVDRAVLEEYGRGLRDRAAQFGKYPSLAKQRGWQGTVNVLVRFARNGVAYQISVKDSSGHKMLDEQAVETVELACAHYVLPHALTNKAFSFVVPVEFKLL